MNYSYLYFIRLKYYSSLKTVVLWFALGSSFYSYCFVQQIQKYMQTTKKKNPKNLTVWIETPSFWCTGKHVSDNDSWSVEWCQRAHHGHQGCLSEHCGCGDFAMNLLSSTFAAEGPDRASAHRCKSKPPIERKETDIKTLIQIKHFD